METEKIKVSAFYVDTEIHEAIKAFCKSKGLKLAYWMESAIVAVYENEIVKGGDNGTKN